MIKLENNTKAIELYSEIKQFILENQTNPNFKYESSRYLDKKDGYVAKEEADEETKKQYIKEEGEVSFENTNEDLVTIKILHWHNYVRWSRFGIDENPCFKIEIYTGSQLIWELISTPENGFGGTRVSSSDFPSSLLQEQTIDVTREINKEKIEEELLIKYSTFDLEILGKCLEHLVSIFEGENFLYTEAIYNSKITKHGVTDSWEEDFKTRVKMIVKESKIINNYKNSSHSNSVIDKLINDGNAIILEEKDYFLMDSDIITIYSLKDNQLISNINFNDFHYVKEFIDNIIQLKIQHNKINFSEKDILSYMEKFVLEKKDIILKNQNKKFEEKILKLNIN